MSARSFSSRGLSTAEDRVTEEVVVARRVRILVVDDDKFFNRSVQVYLERNGFEVESAFEGKEALRKAMQWKPALVVLDVMLPQENGYRVSRLLKSLSKLGRTVCPRVLLVTARRLDDPDREEVFRQFSLADGVLYKPFELPILLERVRALTPALSSTKLVHE